MLSFHDDKNLDMRTNRSDSEPRTSDIAALLKALDVMEAFADGGSFGLVAVSDRVGINKASAYRILTTLHGRGYVTKNETDRTYAAGPELLALSSRLLGATMLAARARPILEAVREELDETVNLGALSGSEVLYLDIVESSRALRMVARAGQRDPLHSTALGKAILSSMPADAVERLLEGAVWTGRTPQTIMSKGALLQDIAATRARGYAIDDGENELGLCCVAVPILSADGHCREAISVSGPRLRIDERAIEQMGRRLQAAARQIETLVGVRPFVEPRHRRKG